MIFDGFRKHRSHATAQASVGMTYFLKPVNPAIHVKAPLHMSFLQRHVREIGIYGQRDVEKNLWEAVKIVTNENLLGIYDAKCQRQSLIHGCHE